MSSCRTVPGRWVFWLTSRPARSWSPLGVRWSLAGSEIDKGILLGPSGSQEKGSYSSLRVQGTDRPGAQFHS